MKNLNFYGRFVVISLIIVIVIGIAIIVSYVTDDANNESNSYGFTCNNCGYKDETNDDLKKTRCSNCGKQYTTSDGTPVVTYPRLFG